MNITTSNKIYVEIAMTRDEIETLQYAYKILAKISNTLGEYGNELVSPTTGQTIAINEFPRVFGILYALAEEEEWELMQKRKKVEE